MQKGSEVRKSDFPVNKIFLDRWSPRAMSGKEISDKELFTLFEAARWAPSSNNEQPWRFIYAKKGSKNWNKFFNSLVEFNQLWCKNAAVLVCLVSKKYFTDKKDEKEEDCERKINRNHMSDAGAAWENLALQGSLMNLVVHGMGGYDVKKIRESLKVPEDYEIVHMFAIGKPGKKEVLHERMQKSEMPKNNRKPLKDIVFEGEFKG